MSVKAPPTHFLPTFAKAQTAGLRLSPRPWWDFRSETSTLKEPDSQRLVAALYIDATLLVRSTRVSIENVGPRLLAELPHSAPTEVGVDARYLKSLIDTSPRVCSFCSMSPGEAVCKVCEGDGTMTVTTSTTDSVRHQTPTSCSGCSGKGSYECSACDGTGGTQRVEMVWMEDQEEELRYLYFPRLRFGLESAARKVVESITEWPDELAISLTQRLTSGPYRSYSRQQGADESFHGYNVEEAIEKARAQVKTLSSGGDLLHAEVQAWALPMVHLKYKRREALLYMNLENSINIVVG